MPAAVRWVVAIAFLVACSAVWTFVPEQAWRVAVIAPLVLGLALRSWWAVALAPAGILSTLAVMGVADLVDDGDGLLTSPRRLGVAALGGLLLFAPLLALLAAVGVAVRRLAERALHRPGGPPEAGPPTPR